MLASVQLDPESMLCTAAQNPPAVNTPLPAHAAVITYERPKPWFTNSGAFAPRDHVTPSSVVSAIMPSPTATPLPSAPTHRPVMFLGPPVASATVPLELHVPFAARRKNAPPVPV